LNDLLIFVFGSYLLVISIDFCLDLLLSFFVLPSCPADNLLVDDNLLADDKDPFVFSFSFMKKRKENKKKSVSGTMFVFF